MMNSNAIVLVIDDDESVLRSYREALAGGDFTLQSARNVSEALGILAHQAIDVVLMEYLMPGADGLAVLRDIKAQWPDTEVVVITGSSSLERAKEAIRLGAYDFLAKPVSPQEISQAAEHAAIQKRWVLHRITSQDPELPNLKGEAS
jgi:DNA-binding NtrC family response regulator